MDQPQEPPLQLPVAAFPAPPPFWKHFTIENLERATSSTSSHKQPGTSPQTVELAYLKPPPPPSSTANSYDTFSIPQSLNPAPAPPPPDILLFDPESSDFDPASILSRITKSLLLNFLELTTILGNDPVQYQDKMTDINRLMLNVHFVINMYRPHQTREGVKEMLQARLEDAQKEIELCRHAKTRTEEFLKSVDQMRSEEPPTRKEETAGFTRMEGSDKRKFEQTKKLWELINAIEEE